MLLINAEYLDKDFVFRKGSIEIEDGIIRGVAEHIPYKNDDMVIDCDGYKVVPGFVDVHIHGALGHDASDGNRESIEEMAGFLITKGVTSFCPTTMTTASETIRDSLLAAKSCMDNPPEGASIVGVNMEGPFIAKERKGAQKEEFIVSPDYELFKELYDISGGIVKLVDIAPEQDGGIEFVEKAKSMCTISIAHTTADYDTAMKAFDAGVTHATHLFNAMSGFSHRDPGVVGAVFDDERVRGELICDGIHIHPAVLRTAFKVLGDRAMIVSDSIRANGLPEGEEYDLGGQMVTVEDGKATLADGTIAGSVTNLHDEIKNLVSFGVSLEEAVRAATIVPARAIGMERELGSIELGKRADLVVLDKDLEIAGVYH